MPKKVATKKPATKKRGLVKKPKQAVEKKNKLTPKQELFCQLYASDKEFFGNGIQAYAEAYGVDLTKPGQYNVAKAGAYENLTKPYILEKIDQLFEARGLNDQYVDKQLEKLITQDADYKTKLGAIKEYNALKKRVSNSLIDPGKRVTGIQITFDSQEEE